MIRRLRQYYRTALDDLRFQGVSVFVWRALVKAVSPLAGIQLQILFDYDLAHEIPDRPARIDCVVELADEADIPAIARHLQSSPEPRDEANIADSDEHDRMLQERRTAAARDHVAGFMRAGEECFVARVGDEVGHSNWICFEWSKHTMHSQIRLHEGEVYTTDGFTSVQWRSKGLHEAVNARLLQRARSLGCRRAYTITDLTKAGARRGVRRVGWRLRGRYLIITPRWLARPRLLRLSGDIEPILRKPPSRMAQTWGP